MQKQIYVNGHLKYIKAYQGIIIYKGQVRPSLIDFSFITMLISFNRITARRIPIIHFFFKFNFNNNCPAYYYVNIYYLD